MKKSFVQMGFVVLPLLIISLVTSCKKEAAETLNDSGTTNRMQKSAKKRVERAYKDDFKTSYRFIPDIANGWTPPNPGPAWYPGEGEGHATHMGKAFTKFNQYASFGPNGFGSVGAPLNLFPFLKDPLTAAGITVPDNVNSIVFDDKGNSIWFQLTSNFTVPASATRINFTGTADIVGGTGKFIGATGQVNLTGYFNPTNSNDAGVSAEGRITY